MCLAPNLSLLFLHCKAEIVAQCRSSAMKVSVKLPCTEHVQAHSGGRAARQLLGRGWQTSPAHEPPQHTPSDAASARTHLEMMVRVVTWGIWICWGVSPCCSSCFGIKCLWAISSFSSWEYPGKEGTWSGIM